jgi:hypothetical protein
VGTYFAFWTYLANHSSKPARIRARTPEEALEKVFKFYDNPDFREKAKVYVIAASNDAACHNSEGTLDWTFL